MRSLLAALVVLVAVELGIDVATTSVALNLYPSTGVGEIAVAVMVGGLVGALLGAVIVLVLRGRG